MAIIYYTLASTYGKGNYSYIKYQTFPIMTRFGLDFIPVLQMTNSETNTTTMTAAINGICDVNASAVYVSLDNITFEKVSKFSSTWQGELNLSSGLNVIYMKEDYTRGNFSYQYSNQTSIDVDTGPQDQSNIQRSGQC